MKQKAIIPLLACVAAFVCTGCVTAHHAKAWDYKVVAGHLDTLPSNLSLEELLKQASIEGWQVVATGSDRDLPYVILKRAK